MEKKRISENNNVMTPFLTYRVLLNMCKKNNDKEMAHIEADGILIKIAISASKRELNTVQVKSLISIFESIDKWYA